MLMSGVIRRFQLVFFVRPTTQHYSCVEQVGPTSHSRILILWKSIIHLTPCYRICTLRPCCVFLLLSS